MKPMYKRKYMNETILDFKNNMYKGCVCILLNNRIVINYVIYGIDITQLVQVKDLNQYRGGVTGISRPAFGPYRPARLYSK